MLRIPIVRCATFLTSILLFTSAAFAQDELKDSKVLINKGVELFDENKFDEALTYFLQVHEGDTNYAITNYELALTYLADSSFEQAKQMALAGMKLPDANKKQLLFLLAHAYDYLGKADSAIYLYDSIARTYPTENRAYYEKSVVYYQKEDFDKAIPLLQQALMINPYHYRSHAVLGSIYMQQGRLTEAYMACAAALLFTNDINVAGGAITALSAIARQSKEITDYYDQRKGTPEVYREIDEIIHAKLALNNGYEVPSVMGDDEVIRVAHAIMEKISYEQEEQNFAMQYYVPLFKKVYDEKLFDPFILLLFSNYGIETVERYAKKQKRDITDVKEIVFPYWNQVIATRTLEYYKRDNAPILYTYDLSDGTYIVGNMAKENGKIAFKEGMTKVYDDGNLIAEGKFNNKGNKEGPWRFYYGANGALRLSETYKNGEIVGEAKKYRENGFLIAEMKYDNSSKQTEEREYTYNGTLDNITIIKSDKESEVVNYHIDGSKAMTLRVKDGTIADGKYKSYYSNGNLEKEIEILDGKLTGVYKEYYENGKPEVQATYIKGKRNGVYTSYYDNGQKDFVLKYDHGEPEGDRMLYNERGQLTRKTTFKNGKRDGLDIQYNDEKEYYIITYQNGVPVGYTYKGEDGKEIKDESKKLSMIKLYYPNGNVEAELPLKNGLIDGEAKYYYSTGSLREVVPLKNDERHGTAKEYFKNGKLYMQSVYVNGERTGPYKSYFASGILQGEGYLIDNKKEGVWKFYNANGKIMREAFYLNGDANGPSRHYDGNGKLQYIDYYDRGLIMRMEQYDQTGKIMHEQIYPLGTGKYYFIFPNRNISFEAQLKNGKYEGACNYYYPDKTIKEKGFYANGERDSTLINYYPDGSKSMTGRYYHNRQDGKWTYYNFDGTKEREVDYVAGDEEGKDKYYFHGQLRYEYNMYNDRVDGDQIFYGEDNKVALVYTYKDGNMIGYTYEAENGKLLPLIPMKNGTAKITSYYPNGKKAVELSKVENVMDGKVTVYYSNGNVANEKSYDDIQLNGAFKSYYMNGKPYYIANYNDNVLDGEEKLYDENGNVIMSANYVMGELHGTKTYNDPKTGKQYTLTYQYGQLLTIDKK